MTSLVMIVVIKRMVDMMMFLTQGGWVPIKGPSAIQLATSLSSLTNLTAFTLKKDCTLDILKALVDACNHVLRLLDVEESRGVGFSSVFLKCLLFIFVMKRWGRVQWG